MSNSFGVTIVYSIVGSDKIACTSVINADRHQKPGNDPPRISVNQQDFSSDDETDRPIDPTKSVVATLETNVPSVDTI